MLSAQNRPSTRPRATPKNRIEQYSVLMRVNSSKRYCPTIETAASLVVSGPGSGLNLLLNALRSLAISSVSAPATQMAVLHSDLLFHTIDALRESRIS
jgi:hypothetical protein